MKRNKGRRLPSRDRIDRLTLLVLAIGLLIAVLFSVAKGAVRDYRELEHEIRETAGHQQGAFGSNAEEPMALRASTRSQSEGIVVVLIEIVPASSIPSAVPAPSRTMAHQPDAGRLPWVNAMSF
jgi:hypothetical protein